MRELCRASNPRTRYSLSNLYHAGMRVFECIATRENKKMWVMLLIGEQAKRARHYQECTNSSWCGIYMYGGTYAILVAHATHM